MPRILSYLFIAVVSALSMGALAQIPPAPQPLQVIAQDPIFGPICAGPRGPGPCADVERFLSILQVASTIQLQQIGFDPSIGPICAGPLGPGPCQQIQMFLATKQVASQQIQAPLWGGSGMCMGPLGPGPCEAVKAYLMQAQAGMGQSTQSLNLSRPQLAPVSGSIDEPMCIGPMGPMPCTLISQLGLDHMDGNSGSSGLPPVTGNAQTIAQQCARRVGVDVAAFAVCTNQKIVLPANQQAVLDCAVESLTSADFANCAAKDFGISLSNEQLKLAGCGIKSKGEESDFIACLGHDTASRVLSADEKMVLDCAKMSADAVTFGDCAAERLISRDQRQMINCAISSPDASSFATCALPNSELRLSDSQRVLARCALKANGDAEAFSSCAGSMFLANKLGAREQAVLTCATNSGGDSANFAGCSAKALFGDKLAREQYVAVQCAGQSGGDPTGFATCAGANLFNLRLNPEQQIAVQCVVSTGGQPYTAAGCIGSRLTARELGKCLSDGIGGEKGCFGDNNDLVGKNGWMGRTLGQIAGGPGSVFHNPSQIWGGDNSFVRNPGQIWGGSNSFIRNPRQIWGGHNSVFNNPSQLLSKPKPVQIGTVGGKRICLPWC